MKYYEVEFTLTPCTQAAQDVLSAMAGETGFETFEETATGLLGYVQQSLFDTSALDAVLEGFPFADTRILYKVREAEDRDWNEQWEQEGFEPIAVTRRSDDGRCQSLVIHDGRHLPTAASNQASAAGNQTSADSDQSSTVMIEIDAHLAFGTGTHETTRMICAALLDMELAGRHVLDCGCGTGILGICALKLGAAHCTAYDIDEWSVDNTRHNSVINQVDDRLTPLHGDAALLCPDSMDERFDVVMANINRNILLADMERFVAVMQPGATLILSGFYLSDCPLLDEKAQQLGLTLRQTENDGEWACMVFGRQ